MLYWFIQFHNSFRTFVKWFNNKRKDVRRKSKTHHFIFSPISLSFFQFSYQNLNFLFFVEWGNGWWARAIFLWKYCIFNSFGIGYVFCVDVMNTMTPWKGILHWYDDRWCILKVIQYRDYPTLLVLYSDKVSFYLLYINFFLS